jgi:glucose-6-phosphate isomerase
MTSVNLATGRSGEPTSVRTVRDLAHLFPNADPSDDRVVYRTYGMSGEDTDQPELRWATTVIEPGDVNGQPFMTRGHAHVKPERGEWMMTLSGTGELWLKGDSWHAPKPMRPGSIHMIDGALAHRVVNTGQDPLAFIVVWLSDCGHDYTPL